MFALCPFVNVFEVEGLAGAHLYGRRDLPRTGVSAAAPWFGQDAAALSLAAGGAPEVNELRPADQAKLFMDANELRIWVGTDGVERHFGSTLGGVNCPVPQWVYRGW